MRGPSTGMAGEATHSEEELLEMASANTRNWVRAGLWCLPIAGALTLWSSTDPQPDPTVDYEAWARFVTTDRYVLGHVFGSILGLTFAIFGSFALGVHLSGTRAGRLGLVGRWPTREASTRSDRPCRSCS